MSLLDADVELVHRRVLQVRVDDVDARGAGARQDEAGERIRERRSEGRKLPGRRIEEEHVAGTDLDRQRAAVEPALERLDLQHDAVVVDAVAAANDETAIGRVPGKADPRPEVVQIALPLVRDERQHDRIELVDAALIVDLGVDLVAQARDSAAAGSRLPSRPE